jgi:hypothetical protein
MTRLGAALWIGAGCVIALASAFAIAAGGYAAIKGQAVPDGLQTLVSTSALVIGALGASAWSALKERTKTAAEMPAPNVVEHADNVVQQ